MTLYDKSQVVLRFTALLSLRLHSGYWLHCCPQNEQCEDADDGDTCQNLGGWMRVVVHCAPPWVLAIEYPSASHRVAIRSVGAAS